jgi:hypothetical protein
MKKIVLLLLIITSFDVSAQTTENVTYTYNSYSVSSNPPTMIDGIVKVKGTVEITDSTIINKMSGNKLLGVKESTSLIEIVSTEQTSEAVTTFILKKNKGNSRVRLVKFGEYHILSIEGKDDFTGNITTITYELKKKQR